ncbi:hypothetical protein UF75_4759 [Desulfosporosinus sp. I2]|uniref:DUF7878 domain-containing protein n=1 Tax=Desulfosporosinus sp. I2 TaxID=1617025 RepID=UPI0005EDCC2C|nr:hypothetical protein [Desulfosporosinus sp. I2]KJR44865.1 hypothetical protein UF75_4759 [Desulfosporosinus sp. I2]
MDIVSNKIIILFKIDSNRVVNKELITTKNYKVLADVEGLLEIRLNDMMFFQEDYILLLEFGIFLTNWISKVKRGIYEDFKYETMDYSESPLLVFQRQESSYWKIHSDWQKIRVEEEFSLEELLKGTEAFVSELNEQLEKIYKISMAAYL